jgi:hypothetical protein
VNEHATGERVATVAFLIDPVMRDLAGRYAVIDGSQRPSAGSRRGYGRKRRKDRQWYRRPAILFDYSCTGAGTSTRINISTLGGKIIKACLFYNGMRLGKKEDTERLSSL